MALDRNHDRLPCDVELATLVAQITDNAPATAPALAHQASCSYCQTALRDLREAWGDVQALARAPVPIPPGLTARIMHRVRDLARHAAENLILTGTRGHTQISHTVIAQVARRTTLAVPGVLFASARLTPGQADDPARLYLAIRLVTIYGPALDAIAAAVRSTLNRRLSTITGANVDRIDITFTDIDAPSPKP
jgi:uncharacterized alkaline shock family protein YloU